MTSNAGLADKPTLADLVNQFHQLDENTVRGLFPASPLGWEIAALANTPQSALGVSSQAILKAIDLFRRAYDFVLLDCSPSLGVLTLNALTAADSVLVPLQCEYYALEGLTSLLDTIKLVQRELNPGLELEGILLTMFDSRNNLSHQVAEEIRAHFPDRLFSTVIGRNVRLSESPSHGKPALLYDVHSTGAQNYLALAKELIENGEEGRRAEKGLG